MGKSMTRRMLRDLQYEFNIIVNDFADCSICGFCCKNQDLTLFVPDLNRISRKLQINKKFFLDKYTHYNEKTREIHMNMPCPFFKDDGLCAIYEFRPVKCRDFPVYVLENYVNVMNVETCAKANLLQNAFIEFISKYDPVLSKRLEDEYNEGPPKNLSSPDARLRIPMKYIKKFLEFLQ